MHTHETLLGCTVKDTITNFVGVATGFIYYMTGCNQALVTPLADATGNLGESKWFDVQRLEIDPSRPRIKLDNAPAPGFIAPPKPQH